MISGNQTLIGTKGIPIASFDEVRCVDRFTDTIGTKAHSNISCCHIWQGFGSVTGFTRFGPFSWSRRTWSSIFWFHQYLSNNNTKAAHQVLLHQDLHCLLLLELHTRYKATKNSRRNDYITFTKYLSKGKSLISAALWMSKALVDQTWWFHQSHLFHSLTVPKFFWRIPNWDVNYHVPLLLHDLVSFFIPLF